MNRVLIVLLALSASFVLLAVACGDSEPKQYTGVGQIDPPIDPKKGYTAVVEVKDKEARFGIKEFTILFFLDVAPKNVESVIFLGREDFYDGVTFHRVEPGVVVQFGDPTFGDPMGTGGPGYTTPDEFHTKWSHDRPGMVGMANAGPDQNGSQIYITLAPAPHLDAFNPDGSPKNCADPQVTCNTIIGRIIAGLPVIESIKQGDEIKQIRMVASAPR